MNPKAAIYCRLSEEDKHKQLPSDDSGSIQNQKSMLQQYAAEHGWEVYDVYSDDDYAGADRNRPAFNRLLNDASKRRFDIILCKTQSRFTRELELVETYIHGLLPLWGIRFVSIVDNADTANKGNKKSRQINGLVNEWYLEDMSENIRSVLTDRRKNGLHIGSFALYGYQKDPDQKGRLLIDEEAAAVVREVFTLYAHGYGKTAIARILNEKRIPNPTEYKRLHGLRYHQTENSTLWKYDTISHMLTNEMYIGNMVQGRSGSVSYKTKQKKPRPKSEWYIVKNTHEPIISQDLWEQVQALLTQRARPFQAGSIGLFAGKARCLYCGYTMRSTVSRGRRYLKCPNRHVSKDACPGAFIRTDALEQLVLSELNSLSEQFLDKDALEQSILSDDHSKELQKQLQKTIAFSEKKAAEYTKALHTLYLDKVTGLISQEDFTEMSKEFTAQRIRFERQLAESQTQYANAAEASAADGVTRLHEIRSQYLPLKRLTREATDCFIDYLSIGRRTPGTKDVPVEIHWNF